MPQFYLTQRRNGATLGLFRKPSGARIAAGVHGFSVRTVAARICTPVSSTLSTLRDHWDRVADSFQDLLDAFHHFGVEQSDSIY